MCLKPFGIQALVFELLVKPAPIHAFHWLAVFRENRFHPVDYRLEVTPQGGCGPVVLMRGHVLLDRLAFVLDPLDCSFEVLLAFRPPIHIAAADCISRAGGSLAAEMPLCVGHPRTRVDRVPQLLAWSAFSPAMLMILKPIASFSLARPLADINLQRVIENPLLLVVLQVVEIPPVKGVVAFHVLRG